MTTMADIKDIMDDVERARRMLGSFPVRDLAERLRVRDLDARLKVIHTSLKAVWEDEDFYGETREGVLDDNAHAMTWDDLAGLAEDVEGCRRMVGELVDAILADAILQGRGMPPKAEDLAETVDDRLCEVQSALEEWSDDMEEAGYVTEEDGAKEASHGMDGR